MPMRAWNNPQLPDPPLFARAPKDAEVVDEPSEGGAFCQKPLGSADSSAVGGGLGALEDAAGGPDASVSLSSRAATTWEASCTHPSGSHFSQRNEFMHSRHE